MLRATGCYRDAITSIPTPPPNAAAPCAKRSQSAPCSLFPSLPWKSSGEAVPPPCTNTRAHGVLLLRDYIPREPKGHCDDHELEWNPSVPSRSFNHGRLLEGPTSHASSCLCPQRHKRPLMRADRTRLVCIEATRANCNHPTTQFSSTI